MGTYVCGHPVSVQSVGVRLLRELLSRFQATSGPQAYANQLALESSAKALAQFEAQLESSQRKKAGVLSGGLLSKAMWEWQQGLKADLEKEIKAMRETSELFVLVRGIDPKTLSSASIVEALRCIQTSGVAALGNKTAYAADHGHLQTVALTHVCQRIGMAVEIEHGLAVLGRQAQARIKEAMKSGTSRDGRGVFATLSEVRKALADRERRLNTGGQAASKWSLIMQTRVGAYLLDRLIKVARLDSNDGHGPQPAFSIVYVKKAGGSRSWKMTALQASDALCEMLSKEKVAGDPVYLPMLVPPKPWMGIDNGGYFSLPGESAKNKDAAPLKKSDADCLFICSHSS